MKTEAVKKQGVEKVSHVAKEGFSAGAIISLGRAIPDDLIAMCSHGRSGVGRWVMGSVTEKVIQQSRDLVLIIRAC